MLNLFTSHIFSFSLSYLENEPNPVLLLAPIFAFIHTSVLYLFICLFIYLFILLHGTLLKVLPLFTIHSCGAILPLQGFHLLLDPECAVPLAWFCLFFYQFGVKWSPDVLHNFITFEYHCTMSQEAHSALFAATHTQLS